MPSPVAKALFFGGDQDKRKKFRQMSVGPGIHIGANDQEEVNIHRHIMQLEVAMNYLMSENQFFRCLQMEVYLYFACWFLFLILVRGVIVRSPGEYVKFWTPLQPIAVMYIIFFMKYVNKLRYRIDVNQSWYCLAAIICYLIFIVGCTSSVRRDDRRESELRSSYVHCGPTSAGS